MRPIRPQPIPRPPPTDAAARPQAACSRAKRPEPAGRRLHQPACATRTTSRPDGRRCPECDRQTDELTAIYQLGPVLLSGDSLETARFGDPFGPVGRQSGLQGGRRRHRQVQRRRRPVQLESGDVPDRPAGHRARRPGHLRTAHQRSHVPARSDPDLGQLHRGHGARPVDGAEVRRAAGHARATTSPDRVGHARS